MNNIKTSIDLLQFLQTHIYQTIKNDLQDIKILDDLLIKLDNQLLFMKLNNNKILDNLLFNLENQLYSITLYKSEVQSIIKFINYDRDLILAKTEETLYLNNIFKYQNESYTIHF